MFYMGRRAMRGRRGKSLILAGLVIFLIGLVVTVGSYTAATSRGGGTHFVSWSPMIVGVAAMVRGTFQLIGDRRAGVPGPGQEIPQAGPQPSGAGYSTSAADPADARSGAGDQPAYDQPGYALPRNPDGPPNPS